MGETVIEWVDTAAGLGAVVEAIGSGPLALDTEADSYHHYREQVCLIQLGFGARSVLVDPLAGVDLSPLDPVLGDPALRTVLHGADYDLRVLDRDFGLRVRGIFDTMVAARLVGRHEFSLAALLRDYAGLTLDKRHQLADWTRRPLPENLLRYAAEDTRHLLRLAERLEAELESLGRLAWAREEFAHLESVRWAGEGQGEDAFRSVKGAGRLDARGLAVLQAAHGWRDRRGRELDRPATRVLPDRLLIEIARRLPGSVAELSRIVGSGRLSRRRGTAESLLEEIERALARPEARWPRPDRRGRPRARRQKRPLLERLRTRRNEAARRLDLDPGLLASRASLEEIARCLEQGLDWRETTDLRRWQVALVEPWLADEV